MKNKKQHDSKSALLHAAKAVFANVGFDAAATRAVAQRAGTNMALIQYHFGGKQGLLDAVLNDGVTDLLQRLTVVAEASERLRSNAGALVDAFLQFAVVEAPGFTALVVKASVGIGPNAAAARVAAALRPVEHFFDRVMPEEGKGCCGLLFALAAASACMPNLGEKDNSAAERLSLARRWAHNLLFGPRHSGEYRTSQSPAESVQFREPPAFDFVD